MNKAYPKYKPSGVEWLGDVPEHWEVKRARFMLTMNPSKQEINHLDPEMEVAFLPMEAVGEDGSLRLDTTRPIFEVSNGYTFFAEGDVTYAKITPCFENGKGAIMRDLGTAFGFGTTELTVIRPGRYLNCEYLYYLTVSNNFRKNGEAWMYGAGGQKRVPDEFVKEFRIGFPPLFEQKAIAAFLDRETGCIDALIAKKERLLELLAEQRTALISRAVTKGLDASVKLKSSGVEWLGDVPEHWEVKRLKYCSQLITNKAGDACENPVALENIESWTGRYIVTETEFDGEGILFLPQDVLFGKLRPYLAKVFLTDKKGESVGDIFVLRPETKVLPKYLADTLRTEAYIDVIDGSTFGSKMPRVSWEFMGTLPFPLPPLPEQKAIAAFLDRETAKIDALSAKVATAIEKLKEYRTALISSAVTGKIDVREAV